MRTLPLFVIALALLGACGPRMVTPAVSETEAALCDVWQMSLPTRSREDTTETIEAIGRAYDMFEAACQRPVFPK